MVVASRNIIEQAERAVHDCPDALIAVLSVEADFVYISPSVETILGHPRELALGRNIAEFYDPAEVAHIHLTIQDALLEDVSAVTTRNTPLASGGVRRMRGAMRSIVDANTDQAYVLSIAYPCD